MRSGSILVLAVIVVLAGSSGSFCAGTYSGGTGEMNNPYRIANANDMNDIGNHPNDWDKCFVLVSDINLADYSTRFKIIGNASNAFTGFFEGNNHSISNFSYSSTGTNYVGLFGNTGEFPQDVGQVRNLTLTDVNVNGGSGSYVGALVGYSRGSIINCRVEGGIVRGGGGVGGLVGHISYNVVVNCSTSCDVEGGSNTGGLAGYNTRQMIQCYATGQVSGGDGVGGLVGSNGGDIVRCYATGEVTGGSGNFSAGGLAGMTDPESTIQDSYARGDVEGDLFVGGFLGANLEGTVTNCYSVGSVSGSILVGGFVGNNNLGRSHVSCFWDTESSGQASGVGDGSSDGIYGRSTADMKMEITFSGAGWDFNTPIWNIEEGIDYPVLVLQEYVHDYGGGIGSEVDPFLIYTAEQMQEIGSKRYHWCRNFRLMNDIDLSPYDGQDGRPPFNKIGYYNGEEDYLAFTGVFDGNNCTISNFTYITTTEHMVGLFGFAKGANVVIKNLGLVNARVEAAEGYQQIGSLVGLFKDGVLENCYVQNADVNADYLVGGLVGRLREGTISNCQAYGSVVANKDGGGLVGWVYDGMVLDCDANVSVEAMSGDSGGLMARNFFGYVSGCSAWGDVNGVDSAGGLVGSNPLEVGGEERYGIITRCCAGGNVRGVRWVGGLMGSSTGDVSVCYATGSVEGDESVGGLLGWNCNILTESFATGTVHGGHTVGGLVGLNYHIVTDCYSVGSAEGTSPVGGLIGYNWGGVITDCFWDEEVSGLTNMCGHEGVGGSGCNDSCGKTTTEMKTKTTFTSAGWDFVGEIVNGPNDVWTIHETVDYPEHVWKLVNFVGWNDVDMLDYAFFANYWQDSNCGDANDCDGTDLDFSDAVDWADLKIFCGHWLEEE